MRRSVHGSSRRPAVALVALVAVLALAGLGCGGTASPPARNAADALPARIGAPERRLDLLTWLGYAQPQWVRPFERATGCQVHPQYVGSPEEMAALMRRGAGSGYDLVSASSDIALALVDAGEVRPVNVRLIPGWRDFFAPLRSPPLNTVHGVHYGIVVGWGANELLYDRTQVRPAPDSWASIYDQTWRGRVTVPDDPLQIADAALYLSQWRPELGIWDPFELTPDQFDAAVSALDDQRSIVRSYWGQASAEVSLFRRGEVALGAGWPYQVVSLQRAGVPVAGVVPKEGVTGWADSWMLSAHASHPNCAYRWMRWVATPRVQAEQAVSFGETPANRLACPEMDRLRRGSCAAYRANASPAWLARVHFAHTPRSQCGDGSTDCVPYAEWQRRWAQITG